MLTTRKMKKSSRPLNADERQMLITILDSYAGTDEGKWLATIPYTECEYFWCGAMTTESGVLGARPLFGKDIYLAPSPTGSEHPAMIQHWIESIAPTAIHELRHLYQQKCYGKILWSILRLPELLPFLYGKVLIEKDALQIEEQADDVILALKHLDKATTA